MPAKLGRRPDPKAEDDDVPNLCPEYGAGPDEPHDLDCSVPDGDEDEDEDLELPGAVKRNLKP